MLLLSSLSYKINKVNQEKYGGSHRFVIESSSWSWARAIFTKTRLAQSSFPLSSQPNLLVSISIHNKNRCPRTHRSSDHTHST